jgi:adenylate cyclase
MAERNEGTPPENRIEFRVGINLGDVIVEEHDIFGDGVNVAARLEAVAAPGGICVSRVVRDQVRDRSGFAFADLGAQNVKNIVRPVRVYAVDLERTTGVSMASVPPATSTSRPFIAPRLSIVCLAVCEPQRGPAAAIFRRRHH